ncbi:hypothetical protein AAF712_005832 [Marasmius tenuissimus]|uniref:AB hydrolase-1 domain-containing protein n=1 Tax=Marasmius tenuissimus TaxID=585030 RepID=A0ABR3A091_9AGAR
MLFPDNFVEKSVTFNDLKDGVESATKVFTLHYTAPANTTAPKKRVLVLLHGYPQNHTLYYSFVHELLVSGALNEWDVVIPDLPGYGKSSKVPSADGSHKANSKRAIAADIISLVDTLFSNQQKFVIAGHDRGARVAYRLSKDHRERVIGTCIMEIVPTRVVFDHMNSSNGHRTTFGTYHWIFLALPPPLPETLISASSDFYCAHTMQSWTGPRFQSRYNPIALASWIEQYRNPAVLTGALEDYRAGATIDLENDREDEQNGHAAVDCPLLVLHSAQFGRKFDVKGIWERLGAPGKVTVKSVGDDDVGHFIPIEASQEVVAELVPWLNLLSLL